MSIEIFVFKSISVRNNLSDMLLAIEGTIVMSTGLRDILDAMYDARVPPTWEKLSWQSATIGFWFTELLERDGQFRRWCFHGRPKVHSYINYLITFYEYEKI